MPLMVLMRPDLLWGPAGWRAGSLVHVHLYTRFLSKKDQRSLTRTCLLKQAFDSQSEDPGRFKQLV